MSTILLLAAVGTAHLLAVLSPGPSFLVVARTAIASSRAAGIWAAFGMGVGSLIWAVAALFGLNLLFTLVPWLYMALKVAGALFLIWIAVSIWRSAAIPFVEDASGDVRRSASAISCFGRGLFIQLSNPKVVVFFGSILAALLPPHPSTTIIVAVLVIVFFNEFVWYSFVACAFSVQRLRQQYVQLKKSIDRVTGGFLAVLGVKLLAD